VTGSSGFIGRHVVALLRDRGDDVIEVAHRWDGPDALSRTVGNDPLDRALHLGWSTSLGYRTDIAANFASFRASLELVELLVGRDCRHLVAVGSGAEYRPVERVLFERDVLAPTDIYGAMKAALGALLTGPASPAPFPIAWARLFTPVGAGDLPDRLFPSVAQALVRGDAFDLTHGLQRVELLDVRDVAAGLVALSDLGEHGSWNVSSGEPYQLRDVLVGLADRLGDRTLLRFGARPPEPWTRSWYVGNSSKLRSDTAWHPRYDLDAVLDRVSAEWRSCVPPRGTVGTR